ncbi:MAG: FKBP-type peptidyl-prolyl cis-trans isomerase [Gemmatimonadota bacterium]
MAHGWLLGGLLCSAALPAGAQSLRLKPLSPVASYHLSNTLGIPEDSLHTTGRGVWYHDVQPGEGSPVSAGDTVAVHFVGFLTDGTRFTATDAHPFRFPLGADRVIAGWEDGVVGMRVGGRRQLIVPAALGYGAKGSGPVPPNADLVFDITLVAVTHPEIR